MTKSDEQPPPIRLDYAKPAPPRLPLKRIVVAMCYALALAILSWFLLVNLLLDWKLIGNWGFEWGYYGHYNRVKSVIVGMPNVTIVDERFNYDTSLEDFGFQLRTDDGREMYILFSDYNPEMYWTD